MSPLPKEIREVAEQAGREELGQFDDPCARQMGRHVGAVIAQAVWRALEAGGWLDRSGEE